MNPRLQGLHSYPFEKLGQLLAGVEPPPGLAPVRLSVGEPQHAPPEFVLQAIRDNLHRLANYPATAGMPELRAAIAGWLERRFALSEVDPATQVLPVNGTREALFAVAQALVEPGLDARVLVPNPFYQIYEGAALLAGASVQYLNCTAETGMQPDFTAVTPEQWRQCQLLYLCTPGNPTGAVLTLEELQALVRLAREYDFVIVSDECYSEIYPDEAAPPPGLLQACAAMGDGEFHNCLVFHSLSKRSNLPGLRSGFVAGDAALLGHFLRYRTYHGCAMPVHHQLGSIAAWSDEAHVVDNRSRYREKFDAVLAELGDHLEVGRPEAGFYLWPRTPGSDTDFARDLFSAEHVTVLPGRFLGRESGGVNPGTERVRMALVAPLDDCIDAARRIVRFLEHRP